MSKENRYLRTPKIEIDERVRYIRQLVDMGWSDPKDLIRIVRKSKQWDVSDRTLYNYIRRCFKELQNLSQQEARATFGILWSRNEAIYRHAQKEKMYPVMLEAQREMAKLSGAYRPNKYAFTDPAGTKDYGESITNIAFIERALQNSPDIQEQLIKLLAQLGEQRVDVEPDRSGED